MKNIKHFRKVAFNFGIRIPIVLTFFFNISCTEKKKNELVIVRGYGDNENSALNHAKNVAIGKVCGEIIFGSTRTQIETLKSKEIKTAGESSKSFNSESKMSDENLSLVGGNVDTYKILSKGQENVGQFVEIEARVTDCEKKEIVKHALTNNKIVDDLQKITAEIKSLEKNDLFANPVTLAQKYHNARILSQRGEVDRALKAYEEVVKEKIIFADPIQDLVKLSKRIYGQDGSKKFIVKTLSHLKGKPEFLYALQLLDENNPLQDGWDIAKSNVDSFPPLAYLFISASSKFCLTLPPEKQDVCTGAFANLDQIDLVVDKLQQKLISGENLNFYIDSNRAEVSVISKKEITMYRESQRLEKEMSEIDKKYDRKLNLIKSSL